MEALDGFLFDRAVHPLVLTVGPGMVRLGEPVLDAVGLADHVEAHLARPGSVTIARLLSELDTIVSQDLVDPARHGFQQVFKGFPRRSPISLVDQLGDAGMRRPLPPRFGSRSRSEGPSAQFSNSSTVTRFPPFRHRLWVDPELSAQRRERSLRSLYCCSDGVRGRGAPVTYLSHTASFHSNERIAPKNRGIKHPSPSGLPSGLQCPVLEESVSASLRRPGTNIVMRRSAYNAHCVAFKKRMVVRGDPKASPAHYCLSTYS